MASAPATSAAISGDTAPKTHWGDRLMSSLQSIQRPGSGHPWPRWRKIATWLVMMMPAYAIVIYVIGFFYFLPAELKGVGINGSLPANSLMVVNGMRVPDHEGIFAQTDIKGKVTINEVDQFNSRALTPPVQDQLVLTSAQLQYVLVRQAQVDVPQAYQIFRIGNGPDQLVATVNVHVPAPGLAVIALSMPKGQAWASGSYMIVVPESGLDEGQFWSFFTIS